MHSILEARDSSHLLAVLRNESGQDMAEYAILIGLVALAVIVAVTVLGGIISTVFNDIGSSFTP